MICRFFLADNLCIPTDHLHSWCVLLVSKAGHIHGVRYAGGAC